MDQDLSRAQKESLLVRELSNVGYGLMDPIGQEALTAILKQKSGGRMDQEIVEELFSRIRMNPDGTTTLQDFINVWMQADTSVRKNIETYNRKIADTQKNRDETGIQLRAVKEHETYNPNLLINDSKLTIEVFDGRGFVTKTGTQFEPLVYLFCEKQKYQLTHPTLKGNSFDWGERVAIPIHYNKSEVLFQVCSMMNPSMPILETTYPIDRLSDQVVRSENLQFQFTDGGGPSSAIINCSMQWLYSRAKFYTNIIDMLDRELKTSNESKKDAEDNLRALYSLFPSTANVLPRQVNFASVDRFNDFSPIVSRTEPTLALMYITSAVNNVPRMNRIMGYVYIGLVGLSIGLDIIWFIYYVSVPVLLRQPWWSSNYIDSGSLSGLRAFDVIMVGVLWLVKILVIVMMVLNIPTLATDKPIQGIGASQWKSTQDGKMVLNQNDSPGGGVWGR